MQRLPGKSTRFSTFVRGLSKNACNPIYQETASYGHMGRKPEVVKKVFTSNYWPTVEKEVELFTWEKLDYVDEIKRVFKEFKKPLS